MGIISGIIIDEGIPSLCILKKCFALIKNKIKGT